MELDGYSFPSKLEASVYSILRSKLQSGIIKHIQVQDHVYLTRSRIKYVADFKCTDKNGVAFYVEAKGFDTPRWLMIKKLWGNYGPGTLYVYKGSHLRPVLHETIISTIEAISHDT